jgi:outer membrane protein insertion porin family
MDFYRKGILMLNSESPGKVDRPAAGLCFIITLFCVFNYAIRADSNSPAGAEPNSVAKADVNKPAQAEPNSVAQTEPNAHEQTEQTGEATVEGKVIESVQTKGNIYLSEGKILSMARSREGELFSTEEAQKDVGRIATLKGVDFAYYSTELVGGKVRLTFAIKEKMVIRRITFSGNQKYDSKTLIEQLKFERGDYLDKLTAKAGAEKLTEYYKKKGYPDVKVSFDDSGIEQGYLHYTIDQGLLVKIKKVQFKGNTSIKNRELKKVIKSKPKDFGIFQNYFRWSAIDDDLVKIQQAYDRRGYLDTKVNAETNFTRNKKGAEILFTIEEGKQYDVEKIELVGNKFLNDANLMSTFRLKVGQFYSNEKADFDKDEILKDYRQIGFINVVAQSSRQFTADNKIIARFEIKEGDRFRIGLVNISGNKATQDKVIRRILDESEFKPGEWYNGDIAQGNGEGQLEKNIKSNAYAETATIVPVGDKPGKKDAEVRVTEGKTGSIMFGAGVSSTDGLIGQMVYEQRNFDINKWPKDWSKFFSDDAFKGAGQQLRIAAEPGTQVSQYSISWTEPYLRDKPIAMTVAGSEWMRERESYDEERQKAYLGFTHRLKDGWYRTLAFRLENVDVKNIDANAPKEVTDVKGKNLLAGIKMGFGRDITDNRFMPTKGKNFELSYEQVAGDYVFGVAEGTFRWYKTLREDIARRKTVLETKLYAASIVGDAPVFEKFYGGGMGSIRGFEYRGVSPRSGVNNDPIGSKWIVTASGEVSVPLTAEALSGLIFVDTGMIETGGIRASAGIGIQIMIPQWFGPVPMRFELANPLLKSSGDKTQIFSFSAGALF